MFKKTDLKNATVVSEQQEAINKVRKILDDAGLTAQVIHQIVFLPKNDLDNKTTPKTTDKKSKA